MDNVRATENKAPTVRWFNRHPARVAQSRIPNTQRHSIICGDDAKRQGGVLCTENKVLRAKYDGLASVAKYLGRLPLLALTEI
jgi:hypothetical protein